MSPAMSIPSGENIPDDDLDLPESQYQKGVKNLYENGISRLPNRYILPTKDRPRTGAYQERDVHVPSQANLELPIIDLAELLGPNRSREVESLAAACQGHGFFQLVNHGIRSEVITDMIEVSKRFFELPMEERAKYMSADLHATVRYGTSFNQARDNVFTWRDFLKLMCHPMSDVLPQWPSSPLDFRKLASTYAEETRRLFIVLMEAILESLGLSHHRDAPNIGRVDKPEIEDILKEFEDASQLMVVNCFPPCPEPDLTLGMPPHSDYGFLTLVLQDEVEGLQIQHEKNWVTVKPIANSFVVNVGDHLEIFSNGRYKSVLHRVLVNSIHNRISVASLFSLSFNSTIRPCPSLINKTNPKHYRDTDFPTFLKYLTSCEAKEKSFLETIKLT